MATYPSGIVSLTSPSAGTLMSVVSHAGQHAAENAEIIAIETALGVNLANVVAASALSTSSTLAENSDTRVATQKAVKTYADAMVLTGGGIPIGYLDTDGTLAADSDIRVPSQKAVKAYVATNGMDAYATQAQMEAGVATGVVANPLGVAQAIAALTPGTKFKVGSFTRDLTAASGDVSYTGVGFTSKAIAFIASVGGSKALSIGFDTAVARGSQYIIGDSGNADNTSAASIAVVATAGAVQQSFVKTFNADGFTLTWEKTGSPTGTSTIFYLAIG